MEINQNSKKKIKWKNDNSWDLWDNIKCTNIHIIGTQKEKRKKSKLKMHLIELWLKTSQTSRTSCSYNLMPTTKLTGLKNGWKCQTDVYPKKTTHAQLLNIANHSVNVSEVAHSCPTLCDPMDCSLPGSSVRGIFQAKILEWVAISFSRRSSQPRDWTQVFCIVARRFTIWATREVLASH